jgi:hypothetical protein
MQFTQKLATAAAAAAVLTIGGAVASAGVTSVNLTSDGGKSVRNQGHYVGTATYDDDAGKLMITLQNTSPRGFLTGIAFDIAGAATAGYADTDEASTTTVNLFSDARGKHQNKTVKTRRFGNREVGAAINGKFRRRIGTKHGLAVGQSRTFEFDLSGTRAAGLNAESVFGDDNSLVVAFGGLKHKRRDIVTGHMSLVASSTDNTGGPTFDPIPDPGPKDNTTPGGTDLTTDPGGDHTTPGNGDGSNGNGSIPGGNPGGDNGAPHAVPLPPAIWAALATMGLVALNGARKKLLVGRE